MAASRIKGITIEIGGDTTKLQTALKGVNTEIRNTQAQLKDVEKLLKLDPGNTELLAQKHKLLGDAVKETKEKLETLKTAAEQAEKALNDGTISKDQYDALQREIIETENELKRLEEQANQSATALQKISATGEKLKDVGSNIEGAGKKLLPVTATVTALGTASVKTAADFESAMSKVAAVSGATGSDLEALTKKAREMGSKTKFSASEAAEAMNYMAMAGLKTEDMLSGIEGIMNLAAASGEDLATISDIVTDALTAFGLSAQDSGHFADVLAAASSNANTNVSMMGETFKYCAPIAGALGFSVEDTAEAIGLMANTGIKSSQAGTSLRTIMTNLSGEVKICGENIGEVTVATTNADGSMRDLSDILADCRTAFSGLSESEKAAAAESLVGKNAMSGFLALMNAGEGDIAKLSGAIDNCNGAVQNMADTMNNNLEGQLTILKSQLQELAISFGEILLPAVKKIVGWVQGFIDVLNSLPDGVKETIVTVALIAAALGPLLIIIGKITTAVGTIMTIVPKVVGVIKAVKTAFLPLNATMLANPIVLIIAAIVALVAAFIYLWNNCDEFRQFWIDLWESIKEIAVAVWEALKEFFVAAWEFIKTTAETVWNGLASFFTGLWEGIKNTFTKLIIDPEAAAVVREIFDMAIAGMRLIDMARTLNERGIETPGQYYRRKHLGTKKFADASDMVCWNHNNIRNILQQEMYYGAIVGHKRQGLGVGCKHTATVAKEEQFIVEGRHEGIVTKEEFLRAQEIFCEQRKTKKVIPKTYPLYRKVKCGTCGRAMTYKTYSFCGEDYKYFGCPHAKEQVGDDGCCKRYIIEDNLNAIVWSMVRQLLDMTDAFKKKLDK